MRFSKKKACGTQFTPEEPSPAKEVLDEQGEIFSCGGVYLGLTRGSVPRPDHFEYLFLPTHQQQVLVLNNQKTFRLPGEISEPGSLAPKENNSEETIRRLSKDSLN